MHSKSFTQGVSVITKLQLAVAVAVFQHFVPFIGTELKPEVLNVYVPPGEVPKSETVAVDALEPSVNVAGVLVIAGTVGVFVILPVSVPVLTMFADGQGRVDDVHASTITSVLHKLAVPGCLISRWS